MQSEKFIVSWARPGSVAAKLLGEGRTPQPYLPESFAVSRRNPSNGAPVGRQSRIAAKQIGQQAECEEAAKERAKCNRA
jgi:hypothetical protein